MRRGIGVWVELEYQYKPILLVTCFLIEIFILTSISIYQVLCNKREHGMGYLHIVNNDMSRYKRYNVPKVFTD